MGLRSSSEPDCFPVKMMRDDIFLLSSQIAYESMREGIKEMEHQAGRLEEIHPGTRPVLEGKVQVLLQGWTDLGDTVSQNKLRLQEFVELQDFFRSYLAMM